MAVSTNPNIDWEDPHQTHLSRLYSLYYQRVSMREQICDYDYYGFPDPILENGKAYKPDLLATNINRGDVQVVSVFDRTELTDQAGSYNNDLVVNSLSGLESFANINAEMVSDYADIHGIEVSPNVFETVVLFPESCYDVLQDSILEVVRELEIFLWTISPSGKVIKQHGDHANPELNELMGKGLNTYVNGTELLPYTRGTDDRVLLYEFTNRLIKYSRHQQVQEFSIDEIDSIMLETVPPMLGHLVKEERENYWLDFIHRLLMRYELLEQTASNQYSWKKKRFVKEPRYSKNILDEIAEKTGLKK